MLGSARWELCSSRLVMTYAFCLSLHVAHCWRRCLRSPFVAQISVAGGHADSLLHVFALLLSRG